MFERLSSYNLITNLVPGAVLAVALRSFGLPLVSANEVGAFLVLAYALGAISSRLGSLMLDPLLDKMKLLPKKDYPAFVSACKNDTKIDTLVETANGYRTFATAGILFFLIVGAYEIGSALSANNAIFLLASSLSFTLLFIVSYRKQNGYVAARVSAHRGE